MREKGEKDHEERNDFLVGLFDLAFVVVFAQLGPDGVEKGFLALLDRVFLEFLGLMGGRKAHRALSDVGEKIRFGGHRGDVEDDEGSVELQVVLLHEQPSDFGAIGLMGIDEEKV